jgi:hypothetical protein
MVALQGFKGAGDGNERDHGMDGAGSGRNGERDLVVAGTRE